MKLRASTPNALPPPLSRQGGLGKLGLGERRREGMKCVTLSSIHQFINVAEGESMSRQTISISDDVWMALKEISMKQKKPMGRIIEESLLAFGVKPRKNALDLLRMAQERSNLSEEEALALSVEETRSSRRR